MFCCGVLAVQLKNYLIQQDTEGVQIERRRPALGFGSLSRRANASSVTWRTGPLTTGLDKAKKGLWEEAHVCRKNALEIRLQILPSNHPDVAYTYNNMGIALGKLNRFEAAMAALRAALEIRQFPPDNTDNNKSTAETSSHYRHNTKKAATLHNMGNVQQQAGHTLHALLC